MQFRRRRGIIRHANQKYPLPALHCRPLPGDLGRDGGRADLLRRSGYPQIPRRECTAAADSLHPLRDHFDGRARHRDTLRQKVLYPTLSNSADRRLRDAACGEGDFRLKVGSV